MIKNVYGEIDVNNFLAVFKSFYDKGLKEKRCFYLGGNFSISDFFNIPVPFDSLELSDTCMEIEHKGFYFILWWDSISRIEKDNEEIYYLYMKDDEDNSQLKENINFRFVVEFNCA